jgi:putative DNA primase/helicase
VFGNDPDLISFIQRVLGYCLSGETTEQAMFFFYGIGANGKSTLLAVLALCLGDYYKAAPIETFTDSKNERHPTELATLKGARVVVAVETEEGRSPPLRDIRSRMSEQSSTLTI